MSPFFLYLASGIAFAVLLIAGLVVLGGLKTKGRMERALNMALFLVRVPRHSPTKEGQPKNEKEIIAVGEQLLTALTNFHAKGWNKFIYGEPYLALEMAVHHLGEEIHFYLAIPRSSEEIVKKQLYSFYPGAEVVRVNDYNIFDPQGQTAGSYLVFEKEEILPLRTYQKLEVDPLESILTAMSQLQAEGEGAAMQLLIRPSHQSDKKSLALKTVREMQSGYSFKEALRRAKHPPKESDQSKIKMPEKPKMVNPSDEEVIKAMAVKAAKPNFDVNLRLVASALSAERAKQILDNFYGASAQFISPDLNYLRPVKLSGQALTKLIYQFSFRLFEERQKMLMSTEEVNSLYHLPLTSSSAPKVHYLKAKPAEPPANLPTEGIVLGKNIFRGTETLVRMTDEDRRRHLYVIGQTGTGKTTIMKAMVRQDIESGQGVCVMDPHGDFAEFALSVVPKQRAEEVIYFDPGDLERPLGLNMFEIDPTHPEQKTMVINELFGIIDKLYDLKTTGGPMFEKYFKNAALLLLDDYTREIPTLADISRVLVNDQFRADKLSRETNPLVKEFWQLEAEKAGGEASLANMAPYISSKVDTFVSNEFLRPIINQKKSAFNFRQIMDERKILIVNLSKGRIGDLNANLLGLIIVGKLLMAALSRVDLPEAQRPDFYLYMDEFQNFTTESIATILSEARKYRLSLIIAHQFIKQLQEKIRDAVFGNVGSLVAFRISPDDAEFMKNKFEPVFTPSDLINIDNLNCYLNLLIKGQTTRPFNLRVETERVFGEGSSSMATLIKDVSRLKYGRPREEVEEELRRKYQ